MSGPAPGAPPRPAGRRAAPDRASTQLSLRPFSHRPQSYSSAIGWLLAGAVRDWRGVLGALIGGWFGVPAALGSAVAAALLVGALFGLNVLQLPDLSNPGLGPRPVQANLNHIPVIGHELTELASPERNDWSSVLLVLAGLPFVGPAALIRPWYDWYLADPVAAMTGGALTVAIPLGLGLLYTLYAVAFEGVRLRLTGARRMSRREAAYLEPILHECAQRLGLTNVPRLLIDDRVDGESLGQSRHIVLSRGVLDAVGPDREALAAVLAHELSHWRTADAVARLFVRGVAAPLYLPYLAAGWVMRVFDNTLVRFVVILLAWPVLLTVRWVMVPLQGPAARQAEYRADQAAVAAGCRAGIRRLLDRPGAGLHGSRNIWDEAMLATHPPAELRLEAVEEPGRQYSLVGTRD